MDYQVGQSVIDTFFSRKPDEGNTLYWPQVKALGFVPTLICNTLNDSENRCHTNIREAWPPITDIVHKYFTQDEVQKLEECAKLYENNNDWKWHCPPVMRIMFYTSQGYLQHSTKDHLGFYGRLEYNCDCWLSKSFIINWKEHVISYAFLTFV